MEISKGNELLSESGSLIARLPAVHVDDSIHAVVRDLTSSIADVTSVTDVIERKLDNTFKVYEHLDQVTSLLVLIIATTLNLSLIHI